jgi:hypothetical protein
MDSNEASPDSTPSAANGDARIETPVASGKASFDWRYWARRLLVCNPFFLCSAALLLFGVNRLSNDPTFLGDEIHNLLFNFFSLQFYEVLVVATAIVLARRKVWYDSALLVVLENGLVLVPFMLISQATMQNDSMTLAWTLTLAGGVVAVGRFAGLKRWYPQFNLPWRALLLSLAMLGANVALPLVFRPRMELDTADWQGPNLFIWYVLLPILAAGANLLPRPWRYGGLNSERHWLPLFIYCLWVVGSAVHVWSVAHICDLSLEVNHLAPLAFVTAWTLWHRLSDFVPSPAPRWQQAMLLMTAGMPVLAYSQPRLFLFLTALNLVAYLALGVKASAKTRAMAKNLALASLALLVAGIPEEWGTLLRSGFRREHGLLMAWTVYLVLLALRSSRPQAGFIGAIALGVDVSWLTREAGAHIGLQAGLVFLLLHSLRWADSEHAGAILLRWLAAIGWVAHAATWTYGGSWLGAGITGGGAIVVAATWVAVWQIRGAQDLWVIPSAAALTLLSAPGNWFVRSGSDGLLAMVGSGVLFAVGILVAWTRHRWEHRVDAGPENRS